MGKPKLIYFNARGRAENARLIFAQAGVDFEDERIERDNWPQLKQSKPTCKKPWMDQWFLQIFSTAIPFGQLPALVTSDGTTIIQSIAIARYLAREYNLAGKNNVEMAQADMYVDCLTDMVNSKSLL